VTSSVLSNDSDVDGALDPSTVAIVSIPSSGSAVVNTDGRITYTPGAALGNVVFTYRVKDNRGDVSNPASVTVFVNAPQTAANDTASTRPATPVTISVLTNDQDLDGTLDPATVTIVAPPSAARRRSTRPAASPTRRASISGTSLSPTR